MIAFTQNIPGLLPDVVWSVFAIDNRTLQETAGSLRANNNQYPHFAVNANGQLTTTNVNPINLLQEMFATNANTFRDEPGH